MRDELLNGLTDEQIKKVENCKDPAEILALAKSEGIELTEEQLAAVSGGACDGNKCPKCGSKNIKLQKEELLHGWDGDRVVSIYRCRDCGHNWTDE